MNMRRTPKPWKVSIHVDDCGFTSYMINEDEIAGSESEATAVANAELMEEAPNMLAALEAVDLIASVNGPAIRDGDGLHRAIRAILGRINGE